MAAGLVEDSPEEGIGLEVAAVLEVVVLVEDIGLEVAAVLVEDIDLEVAAVLDVAVLVEDIVLEVDKRLVVGIVPVVDMLLEEDILVVDKGLVVDIYMEDSLEVDIGPNLVVQWRPLTFVQTIFCYHGMLFEDVQLLPHL